VALGIGLFLVLPAAPRWTMSRQVFAFSPDGRYMLTLDSKGTLEVRSVASGSVVHRPLTGVKGIEKWEFAAEGRHVALLVERNSLNLCWLDFQTGEASVALLLNFPRSGYDYQVQISAKANMVAVKRYYAGGEMSETLLYETPRLRLLEKTGGWARF